MSADNDDDDSDTPVVDGEEHIVEMSAIGADPRQPSVSSPNSAADLIRTPAVEAALRAVRDRPDDDAALRDLVDAQCRACDAAYRRLCQEAAADAGLASEPPQLRARIVEIDAFARRNAESLRRLVLEWAELVDGAVVPDYVAKIIRADDAGFCPQAPMDELLWALSDAYDEQRGGLVDDGGAGIATTSFERTSIKFWVRRGDVTALVADILEHLPLYSFKQPREFGQAINSVYFDNDEMELYDTRLVKEEGANIFRVRWYGQLEADSVLFMERKTHHEFWVALPSVKERFTLPHSAVRPFLHGEADIRDEKQALKLKDKDVELALEYQDAFYRRRLEPKTLVSYRRSAFQSPKTDEIRISLDTSLVMKREHAVDWTRAWKTNPSDFTEDDVHIFPFAIVEVKLHAHLVDNPPDFVRRIMHHPAMIRVDKFSKFCHACAMLFPDKMRRLPYWLDAQTFERDVMLSLLAPDAYAAFKADMQALELRNGGAPVVVNNNSGSSNAREAEAESAAVSADDSGDSSSDAEADTEKRALRKRAVAASDDQHPPPPPQAMAQVPATKDSRRFVEDDVDIWGRPIGRAVARSLFAEGGPLAKQKPTLFQRVTRVVMCDPNFGEDEHVRTEKRRKIEPKTYFANERTFLQWMSSAMMMASVGITLVMLEVGDAEYYSWLGMFHIATGFATIIYAFIYYKWRLHKLLNR